MKTWVALLRGINVGKNKRIAMADLRKLLEGLGYEDVQTLLQSGQAVFRAKGTARAHEDAIERAIEAEFAMEVAVLVRTAAELEAVVEANPFAAADAKELHVVFLKADPPKKAVDALDDYEPDEYAFGDRCIYVRLPNGIAGSVLPDWTRGLGVPASSRNWNTTRKLLAKAHAQ